MDTSPKSLMFARFPFMRMDAPEVTDWLIETVAKCKLDPRVSKISKIWINDTPITMGRNRAVEAAKQVKADFLVMIDNDMKPDAYLAANSNRLDVDAATRPFWDSSWDFVLKHYDRGPCMVGAPYCGPPPHENVYVFRWANFQTDHPNADLRIEQYTREEAVVRSGFEEVACLPTGLVIIDMRVFDNPLVKPPYFSYEYTDRNELAKASTEDCVFTRDLNIANIPLFVNWDAWAGHWKMKCVGRPKPIWREQIHQKFRDAVLADVSCSKKLTFVREEDYEDAERSGVDLSAKTGVWCPKCGYQSGCKSQSNSGTEGGDSRDREDRLRAIEVEPNVFAVATAVPRRTASIGILHGGPVASTSRVT